MKIAIITPNYPPEIGACAYQMEYLAQQFVAYGYEVKVITALPNYPTGKVFSEYRQLGALHLTDSQPHLHRYGLLPSHSRNLLVRLFSNLSLAFSVLQSSSLLQTWQPQVVLVQTPPFALGLAGWYLATRCGAKLVVNFSDLWYKGLVQWLAKVPLAVRMLKKIEFFLCQQADFVLAQSQEIIDALTPQYPDKHYFLYRAGVDSEVFRPVLPPAVSPPKFRIVYAGLLGLAQGILALCKQIDWRALEIELHLYGEGIEQTAIRRFIAQNPQQPVFLHTPVPQTALPNILGQFDVALVAQKTVIYGTVPSKMYEAMACGLPVLLIGGGEAADLLIRHQAGVVVAPQAPQALATQLQHLKKMHPTQLRAMGQHGRLLAVSQLDRQTIFKRFIKTFAKQFER